MERRRTRPPRPAPCTPAAPEARSLSPVIPEDIRSFLGDPPLTPHEDPAVYQDLLSRMAQAVTPKDAIEWVWIRDVCDLVWEARRLRLAKAEILRLSMAEAYERLQQSLDTDEIEQLLPRHMRDDMRTPVHQWLAGDAGSRRVIEQDLARFGHSLATLEAQAHLMKLDTLERLDRLITVYDHRRDAILRDLERRRAVIAARLRAVSDAIIDEAVP